jgi:hypothetical protein
MKVRVTFVEGLLGTASANKEIHSEFIASKSADADKIKEELSAMGSDELMDKAMTVFPRMSDGTPMLWDYQVKGFLKESLGILMDFKFADTKVGKAKLSRWTYKKIVDNAVFVGPRQIALKMPEGVGISSCSRPLRAETMRGERVALATSEEVPHGTIAEFVIQILDASLEPLIKECLDFGMLKGIGQWRNSGKGRFSWEEIK